MINIIEVDDNVIMVYVLMKMKELIESINIKIINKNEVMVDVIVVKINGIVERDIADLLQDFVIIVVVYDVMKEGIVSGI